VKKSTAPPIASGSSFVDRERRRHSRKRVLIPASLDFDPNNNAVIVDISRSGLGVKLPPGLDTSHLRLRFTLPETDVLVRATGEVRWRDGTGRTGVRLVAIDCKPGDWHSWFERKTVPSRHIGDSAAPMWSRAGTPTAGGLGPRTADRDASETMDSEPQLISSLRDSLPPPLPPRSSHRSLPWLGLGILVIAGAAGTVVRGGPALRAFLSARRSVDSSAAAPDLPSAAPKGSRPAVKTQVALVEGLPALAAPGPSYQVQARITRGRLVQHPDVAFPEAALNVGIAGNVKATLTISERGAVEQVDILQGDALLAREVISTLMHWRYLPFKLDGRPVSVKLPITVSFALQQAGHSSEDVRRR
jgi:hypothetical protein